MDVTHQTGNEQAALWNGRAGRAWVDAQEAVSYTHLTLPTIYSV